MRKLSADLKLSGVKLLQMTLEEIGKLKQNLINYVFFKVPFTGNFSGNILLKSFFFDGTWRMTCLVYLRSEREMGNGRLHLSKITAE